MSCVSEDYSVETALERVTATICFKGTSVINSREACWHINRMRTVLINGLPIFPKLLWRLKICEQFDGQYFASRDWKSIL